MVFASLTFTADVGLFAGFSQVASFPLFQFILPLALFCALCHVHHDGRETTGALSRWTFFSGSWPNLVPTAQPSQLWGAPENKQKAQFY